MVFEYEIVFVLNFPFTPSSNLSLREESWYFTLHTRVPPPTPKLVWDIRFYPAGTLWLRFQNWKKNVLIILQCNREVDVLFPCWENIWIMIGLPSGWQLGTEAFKQWKRFIFFASRIIRVFYRSSLILKRRIICVCIILRICPMAHVRVSRHVGVGECWMNVVGFVGC